MTEITLPQNSGPSSSRFKEIGVCAINKGITVVPISFELEG